MSISYFYYLSSVCDRYRIWYIQFNSIKYTNIIIINKKMTHLNKNYNSNCIIYCLFFTICYFFLLLCLLLCFFE